MVLVFPGEEFKDGSGEAEVEAEAEAGSSRLKRRRLGFGWRGASVASTLRVKLMKEKFNNKKSYL